MNSSPAVVFDLGKVLLDFDYGIAAPKFAARGRVTPEEARRILNQSALLHRYETGLMTSRDFFETVSAETGFGGDLEEFTGLFGNIFTPMPEMLAVHAALRGAGVPTYIFSNTNELQIGHIRRHFPFIRDFDGYILSFEHGAMKPDERIYAVVEQTAGRSGEEIIYLDDRAENVAAGAARGWRAIHHVTAAQSRTALQAAGVLD